MPNQPHPRRAFYIKCLAALACVLALCTWIWWMGGRTNRLIADIEAAGGRVEIGSGPSGWERFVGRFFGQEARYDVLLKGTTIDDAWLARHDNLRSLKIDSILVTQTSLSRAGFQDLMSAHAVWGFMAPAAPILDDDLALFDSYPDLRSVNLVQTGISADALEHLDNHALIFLGLAGTQIGADDLGSFTGWSSLRMIGLDGRQLTPETVALLDRHGITSVTLSGPDVTDDQLMLLAESTNLSSITLDQTAVTDAAITSLRQRRPTCSVNRIPPEERWYDW